jgi:hypothetical protein
VFRRATEIVCEVDVRTLKDSALLVLAAPLYQIKLT